MYPHSKHKGDHTHWSKGNEIKRLVAGFDGHKMLCILQESCGPPLVVAGAL